jgi:hypothetical protein
MPFERLITEALGWVDPAGELAPPLGSEPLERMFAGLKEALAARKAFVDEASESAEGVGMGSVSGVTGPRASRFYGQSFVDKSSTGLTGLVNQGATCYLNSLLQMLFMTPDFRSALFGELLEAD